MNEKFSAYARPEALVDTEWLAANLDNPQVRIVESNEDLFLYDAGHIPGAVHIDWRRDLNDEFIRDYISPERFAQVANVHGVTPETTVVFYGDKANWWACYALWVFQLFGHTKVKILDGGRSKWIAEGRPITRQTSTFEPADYPVSARRDDQTYRAFYSETLQHYQQQKPLLDVRSAGEFSGKVTHMPEYPQEGVMQGGHIPGARSCPWISSINPDGTFKTADELRRIYTHNLGLNPEDDLIVYCRIGERSSHTWFLLKYLLGYTNVRNYDGSWVEWGNMVRNPVELN